ncbi:DUF4238 domain-containing protein [Rhizobium leguminosarum bv. trifolii]|nr:DUF4238 domain-containing protein [Rhizobium leguminosarum bv. trifolii]
MATHKALSHSPMNAAQEPIRHHFLPVFYLKQWSTGDGRIVEFSIPFRKVVKPKRVHPKGTGFIDRLYAIEGLPGEVSFEVEKDFLSPVDSRAANALDALLEGRETRPQEREAWARFIMTLLMRMPTEITLLKELVKKIEDEVTSNLGMMLLRHAPAEYASELDNALVKYKRSVQARLIGHVMRAMSGDDIVSLIAQMNWTLLDLATAPHELLTSDRPVVVYRNDRVAGETVISLPVGPRKLFVAATKPKFLRELRDASHKKVVEAMNIEVVTGASQFVYSSSDRQLTFIQNRFGTNQNASFVAKILTDAGMNLSQMALLISSFEDDGIRAQIADAIAQRKRQSLV